MAELNIYACQNSECNHIGEYRGTENPPTCAPESDVTETSNKNNAAHQSLSTPTDHNDCKAETRVFKPW